MKKINSILIFIFIMMIGCVEAGISESFEKTLKYMNVPLQNIYGYEINEEIYNKYNLIVYGSPEKVIDKNQRWKDVQNGKWNSNGKKGEYRILGYSVNGTPVNNEIFPDDYVSGKTPLEWNYMVIEDATSSWNDTEKYQTQTQYEYMLNQKLSRNGVTYNLSAKDIGIDKARLEAYATWKTAGSIFTLKKDDSGVIWGATFNIPPMAADAKLDAILNFPTGTSYTFAEEQDTITIPFTFGAEVTGLSGYAKVEDIDSLTSEIEIIGFGIGKYDKIASSKICKIEKDNTIVINRSDFSGANKIEIMVKNTSVLKTCFNSDVPMVDIKEVTLVITLTEELEEEQYIKVRDVNRRVSGEVPRPRITSIKLYRKSITGDDSKVALNVAKKTNKNFICAGQVLVVEATIANDPSWVRFYIEGDSKIQTLDSLTQKFVYDEPKARGEKLAYSSVRALKDSYKMPRYMDYENGVYRLEYIVPYMTKQTINSWNTLRDQNKNGLDIDKNKLFSRICDPYKIKIMAGNEGGSTTKSVDLDVFERWDTVYNRDISEYVK